MSYALIVFGLVALVIGAELLVRGASRLAAAFGVSSLIVGLTVVALGTSAPEFAVSVSSSFSGRSDIAVGNVVGSNIYNVLLILGLSALIIPLVVDQKLIRFDVPLMLVVSLAMWAMSYDGVISRADGLLLVLGLLAFMIWCIVLGRRESTAVKHEYDEAFGDADTIENADLPSSGAGRQNHLWQVGLIVAGLILLVLGAGWLVDGASAVARSLGISDLVIGLTIVALGTSLPELATSVVAALRGERDIAVGNVVGSNLFNILGVLGLSAVLAPNGIPVSPQALEFDIPIMLIVAAACLPMFFTGHLISRWEGALFFGYSIAYTVAVFMMAANSSLLSEFRLLMFGFVIPLTAVTMLVGVWRAVGEWRVRRRGTTEK